MDAQQPTVEQKAPVPPGNIPKGRQTYIMLGMATVIVLAVVFSGSTTPPPKPPLGQTGPTVTAPSKAEIDRYTQALKAEENRLRQAESEANRSRAAFDRSAAAAGLAPPGAIPGQALIGPNGQAYYPAPIATPSAPPERSALDQEREKREYTSLFASNVALTYRKPPDSAVAANATTPAVAPTPATTPEPPPARAGPEKYVLMEGSILEAALTNRLEGSFTGPVNCLVTTNVYSRDHQHLLIPQGSRALGEARRVEQQDQQRLAVVFHRLIFPNGSSVSLDRVQGLDQGGATGLKDKINHHYLSTFGASVALGVLAGFSAFGTGGAFTASGTDIYRQGIASELSRDATRILDRQLNRLPTITVREGTRVKIYLTADLPLPAYNHHPAPPGE